MGTVGTTDTGTEEVGDSLRQPATEALLVDWRNRVNAAGRGHYILASRCRRNNVLLGIPVVVLSSVLGTSVFATLNEKDVSGGVRLVVGSISVLAAILAGVQTFLRYGERAEKHVIAADWYTAVRREIDQLLAQPPHPSGRPRECVDRLRKEISKVGQQSPEIDSRLWEKLCARFGIDESVPAVWRGGPRRG